MPFALLIIGATFLTAGVRGTDDKLLSLVKGDFSGSPNFISWLFAILLIGSLGYVDAIKPVSRMFLALVIIVMFLSNGGFFQKFTAQIQPTGSVTQ